MKILLTGAQGFLGRNILSELLRYHDVRCLVRKRFEYTHPRLEVCVGDISDLATVEQATRGVDAIVHAAAILQHTEEKTFSVNVGGTRNLVEAARRFNVKHFIFISTENVLYDYCQDAYTRSKRQAERLVMTLRHYTILRPSIIYGKDDDKYLSYLISFVKKHPVVPVLGSGKNLLQPVYVLDVVACILQALSLRRFGAYTVPGPHPLPYNDYIRIIADHYHVKRYVLHLPLWLLRPFVFVYEKIVSHPKVKLASLSYLSHDRVHTLDTLKRTFRYEPTSFADALRDIAR